MDKKATWEEHSLSSLRKIAGLYKHETAIGAVSKMKKTDLIEALNKHLYIDQKTLEIRNKGIHNLGGKKKVERYEAKRTEKTETRRVNKEKKVAKPKPKEMATQTSNTDDFFHSLMKQKGRGKA